jgi:flagellar protein FlgJ
MNELRVAPIRTLASGGAAKRADDPAKVRDAAQQFEALLIGQILRSVRESGGWLASGEASSDCATEYAEQQLAATLAHQGGLGMAELISKGLVHER